MPVDAEKLSAQLQSQRRTVDFDTFDIHAQQILAMLESKQIWIAPAYQRQFRWDPQRCSQLIESLLLGIPIPSLFMATNKDSTWEVVDGLQRLSSIAKFAGTDELRKLHRLNGRLALTGLSKLTEFEGLTFDQLPTGVQQHFWTRPIKVITLSDKSDMDVRYDLFERLNSGGIALTDQEIRDCVFRGAFAEKLEAWAKTADFGIVVRLNPRQQRDGTAEECVLRFFALSNSYQTFKHSVKDFLNGYMKNAAKDFDYEAGEESFTKTFRQLAKAFPAGIRRAGRKGTTPLSLFEGISVGAALALKSKAKISTTGIDGWISSPELLKFTTAATNDLSSVKGRIEFCRDRFLGKPYVPTTSG